MREEITITHPKLGTGIIEMTRGEFHGWSYGVRSIARFGEIQLDVSHVIRHPETGSAGLKLEYKTEIHGKPVTVLAVSEQTAHQFNAARARLAADRRASTPEQVAAAQRAVEESRRADSIMDNEDN